MPLTDASCKNAKPRLKTYRISDANGMYLEVRPNGSRYWRLKYRFDGKEKLLALGVYPETTLGEARAKRDKARATLGAGQDPSAVKQEQKRERIERAAQTFELIAREWHAKNAADWTPGYASKVLDSLTQNVFPEIGKKPITDVTPKDMLDVLTKIEARGANEIASRVKQRCGAIFNYAITRLLIETNPTLPLRGSFSTPPAKNYARLSIQELPEFLRKLDAYEGRKITKLAMQFMAYTFVRTGELRGARWEEFDLVAGQWRIPAERMKMKEQHIVPLSRQVLALLKEVQSITGTGPLVFPSDGRANHPMSENTILYAIYRLGYHSRMTGHGFRGIASTALNEMGYQSDWIERQLAHGERNGVRAAYNHAQYLPQRVKMMQHWADYIDSIKHGGKVLHGKFKKA